MLNLVCRTVPMFGVIEHVPPLGGTLIIKVVYAVPVVPLLVVAVTETWYFVTFGNFLNRVSCMAMLIELIPEKQGNHFCCNKQTNSEQFSIVFFQHSYIHSQ